MIISEIRENGLVLLRQLCVAFDNVFEQKVKCVSCCCLFFASINQNTKLNFLHRLKLCSRGRRKSDKTGQVCLLDLFDKAKVFVFQSPNGFVSPRHLISAGGEFDFPLICLKALDCELRELSILQFFSIFHFFQV